MKATAKLWLFVVLCGFLACIDFDQQREEFCRNADADRRSKICGVEEDGGFDSGVDGGEMADGCGDGTLNPDAGEQCDDSNKLNADDCLATCKLNVCGDSFVDMQPPLTEACDDGNTLTETACPYGARTCTRCNATCTGALNLTGPYCGDNTRNGSEVCDDGNTTTETSCPYGQATCVRCNATCTQALNLTGPYCGDALITGGEVCDDGNNVTETSCPYGTPTCTHCDATCSIVYNVTGPYCGNWIVDGPEVCDDGNAVTCGTCNANCSSRRDGGDCPSGTGCTTWADCAPGLSCGTPDGGQGYCS